MISLRSAVHRHRFGVNMTVILVESDGCESDVTDMRLTKALGTSGQVCGDIEEKKGDTSEHHRKLLIPRGSRADMGVMSSAPPA